MHASDISPNLSCFATCPPKKKDLTAIKLSGGCCCLFFFLKFYDSFSPPLFFLIANASVTTFLMSFPKGPWGPLPIHVGLHRSLLRGSKENSTPYFTPISSPPPSQTPLGGQVVQREGKAAISRHSVSWRSPPAITANNDKKTGLLPEIES